jgi:hypothetical protein
MLATIGMNWPSTSFARPHCEVSLARDVEASSEVIVGRLIGPPRALPHAPNETPALEFEVVVTRVIRGSASVGATRRVLWQGESFQLDQRVCVCGRAIEGRTRGEFLLMGALSEGTLIVPTRSASQHVRLPQSEPILLRAQRIAARTSAR